MAKFPITPAGLIDLEKEIKRLKTEERPKIIKAIASARAHGDLSENAEYHAAKEEQGHNERRLAELETMHRHAQVVDSSGFSGDTVKFGATVTLADSEDTHSTYRIVGQYEADVKHQRISVSSPLARAMIGKQLDDTIEVQTPKGTISYDIIKVAY